MVKLFVNVDHVATVREARKGSEPDPVALATLCEDIGVDGITMHLREDRRHVCDDDMRRYSVARRVPFNFEMAVAEDVVALAEELIPEIATIVPERREEVTTEGGLDLVSGAKRLHEVTARLQAKGILVSYFVIADEEAMRASKALGADAVELHTGPYCHAEGPDRAVELQRIQKAATLAQELGLQVNAGHGLNFENTAPIARLPGIAELNIGHSLVAAAMEMGLPEAARRMKALIHAQNS